MVARTKAILIVLIMCLSAFSLMVPAAGAEPGPTMAPMATEKRVVVCELFTGATCGPCTNADLGLGDYLADHTRQDTVALIYHRPIPGADKLATAETATRHQWYSSGGTSTPNMWVDGKILRVGGFSTRLQGEQWFESQYNSRKNIGSQINITTDGFISPSLTGTVWVNVTALENPSLDNLYLHTVIVRREYHWNAPNGVPVHHYLVRKMLPGANGEAIAPTVGSTISKQYSFDLSNDGSGSDMWTVEDDMAVVAFVQTHTRTDGGSSRYVAEILQSSYSNLRTVPNVPPVISGGMVEVPDGATEDDEIAFKVFYRDTDNYADKDPTIAKVLYKNETSGVMEHSLEKVPSGVPWTEGKWMQWRTKLDPGTYSYRFNASDGEDWALGDTAWNATTFTILPRNKVPQLSTHSFAPLDGDTSTEFRFDIMYRDLDNEAPTQASIYINDVEYTMATTETSVFSEWVTYYFETTMPVGDNHRFYFMFSDGKDSVRFPAVDDSPNWLLGPSVVKPNNAPTLTTALFNPSDGTRGDQFTFTIIYTDGENDHPTISYIYIDEVANIMDPDGFDYVSGEVFRYTTTLDLGDHQFRFLFNDGKNEVRFPASGALDGPSVYNMDPVGVIAAPTDGMRYTPDDYIPFSAVGSDDPEADPLEYKWTSSLDGVLSTQQAFDERLTEGEHTITLDVTDEHGGIHTLSVDILVKALTPEPFVVRHESNTPLPVEQDMVRYTITLDNRGETIAQGIEVKFFVDDVLENSDTLSVSVGNEVEVRFTWEAVLGLHTMRVEVPGDSYTWDENVDRNSPPAVTTDIQNEGGKEVSYKTGTEVYFKATASDENGDDMTYLWDFGDGTPTSSQASPSHIYAGKGTYTVTVTVTDTRGGSITDTFQVEITKPKSQDESPGFGAIVAIAALMAVIVAVSRRRL